MKTTGALYRGAVKARREAMADARAARVLEQTTMDPSYGEMVRLYVKLARQYNRNAWKGPPAKPVPGKLP